MITATAVDWLMDCRAVRDGVSLSEEILCRLNKFLCAKLLRACCCSGLARVNAERQRQGSHLEIPTSGKPAGQRYRQVVSREIPSGYRAAQGKESVV
jgi:hypothetical protein